MPILASLAPIAFGAYQSLKGSRNAKDAQSELEKLRTPKPNQSIIDYYNNALQRYNVSPYQTAAYKNNQNQTDRRIASGIEANNNSGLGTGVVPNLVQRGLDANLKSGAMAEGEQDRRFGVLGNATRMRGQNETNSENNAFQKQYNLLALKAQGGNKEISAGINNIWGGIGAGAQIAMSNKEQGLNIWGNPIKKKK